MAACGGRHPGQAWTLHRLGQGADRIRREEIAAEIELGKNQELNLLGGSDGTNRFQAGQIVENRGFAARLARALPDGQANSLAWLGGSGKERPGCDMANSR